MAVDTTNALTTASTFASVCGLSDDDLTLVEKSIDAASWWFNTTTGRELKARAQTEYLDGDGTVTLYLNQRPVSSVVLYIDTARAWGSDSLLTENTDYVVYAAAGKVVFITGGMPVYPQAVKAVYTGGYATIPYEVEMAALRLARFFYGGFKDGSISKSSMTTGAGTIGYRASIPADIVDIAEKYTAWWREVA